MANANCLTAPIDSHCCPLKEEFNVGLPCVLTATSNVGGIVVPTVISIIGKSNSDWDVIHGQTSACVGVKGNKYKENVGAVFRCFIYLCAVGTLFPDIPENRQIKPRVI